jgi:hypothetical protein
MISDARRAASADTPAFVVVNAIPVFERSKMLYGCNRAGEKTVGRNPSIDSSCFYDGLRSLLLPGSLPVR